MAAFGLELDGPLLPNIDAFINPSKDEDAHRNAVVSAPRLLLYLMSQNQDKRRPVLTVLLLGNIL